MFRRIKKLAAFIKQHSLPKLIVLFISYLKIVGFTKIFRILKIIEFDYGHFLTVKSRKVVDNNGSYLPWFSYPAIDYLKQLDFTEKDIYEYGVGYGSYFWASRARSITSVEKEKDWYSTMLKEKRENQKIILAEERDEYIHSILRDERLYDIIIIDGHPHTRLDSARLALEKLKRGGFILLDNSDWFTKTAKLLRESGLIQIDFTGIAPLIYYTVTTSIFLDRQFDMKPRLGVQPEPGAGSLALEIEE